MTGLVRRAVGTANSVCALLATTALVLLMLLTVADVAQRSATGQSIAGAVEIAPLILLAAVAFGLGNGEATGTHVRTSLVTDRLPSRIRAAVRTVGYAACFILLTWLTVLSFERAVEAFEYSDTTAGFQSIPTWPARAVVPIGFALWALTLLLRLVDDLRVVFGAAPALSTGSSSTDPAAGASADPQPDPSQEVSR